MAAECRNHMEFRKLGDLVRVPEVPVEVFVGPRDRSVMSILVRPILDQLNGAFGQN